MVPTTGALSFGVMTGGPDTDVAYLESLPVDSLWVGGHVASKNPSPEAMIALAWLAARTERVRVGTAILLLPLYHPVLVGKQLADLDARSGGRLSVGVGVGGEFPHEFEALGVPTSERGARTDEAIAVLRALWTGRPVTHHGKFFDLGQVELRAVGDGMRAGGPPILVSGRKEPAMRRAARLGDGWMPYLMSPSAYARSVETIRTEAASIRRDLSGFDWTIYLYCSVRNDSERAHEDVAAFLGRGYGDKPREMLDRIAPAGTPEEVAARVQEYVDAGARHIIISPAAPSDTLEIVQLAATEVLPRLRIPG